jgi:mannose-6-phosphate isomerase-like protein (cupin superfamily)
MSATPTTRSRAAEPRWFIHNLARVHVGGEMTGGRMAVVELAGREGDMPPLHVHHREDVTFYVLEGRLTLFVGGERIELGAGECANAPMGVPHVYRVDSPTARWLGIVSPAGFDRFVVAASDPAPAEALPPADAPVDLARIGAAAAAAGIELLGPPGALPE